MKKLLLVIGFLSFISFDVQADWSACNGATGRRLIWCNTMKAQEKEITERVKDILQPIINQYAPGYLQTAVNSLEKKGNQVRQRFITVLTQFLSVTSAHYYVAQWKGNMDELLQEMKLLPEALKWAGEPLGLPLEETAKDIIYSIQIYSLSLALPVYFNTLIADKNDPTKKLTSANRKKLITVLNETTYPEFSKMLRLVPEGEGALEAFGCYPAGYSYGGLTKLGQNTVCYKALIDMENQMAELCKTVLDLVNTTLKTMAGN